MQFGLRLQRGYIFISPRGRVLTWVHTREQEEKRICKNDHHRHHNEPNTQTEDTLYWCKTVSSLSNSTSFSHPALGLQPLSASLNLHDRIILRISTCGVCAVTAASHNMQHPPSSLSHCLLPSSMQVYTVLSAKHTSDLNVQLPIGRSSPNGTALGLVERVDQTYKIPRNARRKGTRKD